MSIVEGIPRSEFYARLARDIHCIIDREWTTNLASPIPLQREEEIEYTPEPQPVIRVNIQDALNRLTVCPVCGDELEFPIDYPMERTCHCGDFTIVEVAGDGEVVFQFRMIPLEE